MTFILQTENLGHVEAGYCSAFTQEIRIEDLYIQTLVFCNVVGKLAKGYVNNVKFCTNKGEYEASWNLETQIIKIGKYEISAEEFGLFADYVFRGGFMGWNPDKPDWRPDFVKYVINDVMQYMKKEQHKNSYLNSVKQKEIPSLEEII